MSDKMEIIEFEMLLDWIFEEFNNEDSIFGIPSNKFLVSSPKQNITIFNSKLDSPLGPAAGPHTQLAQNIISSFLCGARFFELKTVQKIDDLEISKPCIDANNEGYNTEWSQELKIEDSFDEYLKAWFLIHLLDSLFISQLNAKTNFIFNMSVGYNLAGIKTTKVDDFINKLKDASLSPLFEKYKAILTEKINSKSIKTILINKLDFDENRISNLKLNIESISKFISNSVTLSTMHGCPPAEIESICKYLIEEENLHTYVKLNPTLLGEEKVRDILDAKEFSHVKLNSDSFNNDLKMNEAIPMLVRLQAFAHEKKVEFGIKLSNTLAVVNKGNTLKGAEKYLSGKALFPLTVNLAKNIVDKIGSSINISFSGGADQTNITDIYNCGIYPITIATDLLKPGGFYRLAETAEKINDSELPIPNTIDLKKLNKLAADSILDKNYNSSSKSVESIKVKSNLPMFDCFIAPCQSACPIHQDVAEYITLIEQQRFEEAIEVITDKNPLPNITGYICDHQCMEHCTRLDYDSTVNIRELKKIAAENALNNYKNKLSHPSRSSNIKVAVIGAGPSGLSSAYFLARNGIDVTIFEKKSKPGGVAQYSIPRFRLPQKAIDADIDFIKHFGVKFNFDIDEKFTLEEIKSKGFDYIHIAIGASKTTPLQLAGMNKPTISAISFLEDFNVGVVPKLGKRVAVIGAGNSAMDASRAAKKCKGVEHVMIVYRRTMEFMPADKEEIEDAIADNVEMKELLQPISFGNGILKCQKMQLGKFDNDGRRRVFPIENEFFEMEVDSIISAIGEKVDVDLLELNNIDINHLDLNLNVDNVFIGGDALRGPANLIEAVADGKEIAERILVKENLKNSFNIDYTPLFELDNITNKAISEKGKIEREHYLNSEEASLCLVCNYECNKCVDVCPNRANIAIKSPDGLKDKTQIIHIDGMCNECGNCETFCPHNGKPYTQKPTIFWTEDGFNDSTNDGFFVLSNADPIHLLIRFKGEENEITIKKLEELTKSGEESKSDFNKFLRIIISLLEEYSYMIKVSSKYYRKDLLKW